MCIPFIVADDDNSDIEQQLDKLENDLMDTIALKTTNHNTVENYRQVAANLNNWFDNIIKKIDVVDVGSGLNCAQKLDAIAEIQNECEGVGLAKLEELKHSAQDAVEVINNLDAQQVEEQLKSSDRRYNDVIKRIARKEQMIGATNKSIQSLQNEIEQLIDWLNQQISHLKEPQPFSSDSNLLNLRVQKLKGISKDADVKQVLAETLERRVANMQSDLEQLEKSQLESDLREIGTKQKELGDLLAAEINATNAGLDRQKAFEADVDKFKSWLRTKLAEVRKHPNVMPLQSTAVENEIQAAKTSENDIIQYGTNALHGIQKQAQNILKNCADQKPVDATLEKLANEFDELKNETKAITQNLAGALEHRKAFENDVSKLDEWFSEVEISTQNDVQLKSLPILEEQLIEFEKLKNQKESLRPILGNLHELSKAISPTLSSADKMKLNEQLKALKDKFNKPTITDRIKIIEEYMKRYKNSKNKLAQCIETLQKIRQEINDLKKPISIQVESVKILINTYERILRDLNDNRSKVSAIQIEDSQEVPNVLAQHDETIAAVEKEISSLKQAQALREQYYDQIEQIDGTIGTYGIQIADIEKSIQPIEDKLQQYDEMTAKIRECEGLLASVHDKGRKIAAEGTVADSNAITEINQNIKQKLQNLHQDVKVQRQKYEIIMAEHNKTSSELSDLLQWLHNNEAACKSRPLLERDPDSVEHETTKHDAFAKQVLGKLNQVQTIDEQTDVDGGVPASIVDMLSEGRSLIVNLPKELSDRKKYLSDSKESRINYMSYINEFKIWINQAEGYLEKSQHGIDFDNIDSNIDTFNSFFENDRPVKELITQKIQSTVDQIWPTLQTIEQNELSEEMRHFKKMLDKTLNAAKQHQEQFNKHQNDWNAYRDLFQSLRNILDSVQIDRDTANSLSNIQTHLRTVSNVLAELKVIER